MSFEEFDITIKSLCIPYSDKKLGIYKLYKYQEEVLNFLKNENNRALLLEAPTGSGKTLSVAFPLLAEMEKPRVVIGIYPTVELAKDQAASLALSIARCGKDVLMYPHEAIEHLRQTRTEGCEVTELSENVKGDVAIVQVTSDTLLKLSKLRNLKSNPDALLTLIKTCEETSKSLIILTNPDIIWLILMRKYVPFVKEEWERASSESFNELFGSFFTDTLIFFDEFHAWENYSLINAIMLLIFSQFNPKTRVIVSSATLSHLRQPIIDHSIGDLMEVKCLEAVNGESKRQVLKGRRVKFVAPQGGTSKENVANFVEKYLEDFLDEGPCTILADRVLDCINLYRQYRKDYSVALITGIRHDQISSKNDIIIGNTAFEMGVDIPFLNKGMIYASTANQLVQRVGRFGRGESEERCDLIILLEKDVFRNLRNRLASTPHLSYNKFIDVVYDCFPDELTLSSFSLYKKSNLIKAIHYPLWSYSKFVLGAAPLSEIEKNLVSIYEKTYERIHGKPNRIVEILYKKIEAEKGNNLLGFRHYTLEIPLVLRLEDKVNLEFYGLTNSLYNFTLDDVRIYETWKDLYEKLNDLINRDPLKHAKLEKYYNYAERGFFPKVLLSCHVEDYPEKERFTVEANKDIAELTDKLPAILQAERLIREGGLRSNFAPYQRLLYALKNTNLVGILDRYKPWHWRYEHMEIQFEEKQYSFFIYSHCDRY